MDPFLDVDFRKDPNFTLGDLVPSTCRAFGGGELFGSNRPAYEDVCATIPESDWDDLIHLQEQAGGAGDLYVKAIKNQGREGSCVGNATTQAVEMVQCKQFGKDRCVLLSAISLYKRIGSSPGSGAMISDALDEITSRGALPLDTPENRARFGNTVMPATGFYTPFPPGWEELGKLFRAIEDETYIIRTVEGMATALLNQDPVVVGRSGHSIVYARFMKRNGNRVVKYPNSWGNWGDNGFGYDSLGMVRSSSRWAFAIRAVTSPEGR